MKKTTKESKEIEESYRTNLTWNRQREKFLKEELKKHFTTIQGYEWFIVPDKKLQLFREIIIDLTNQTLKPDEKVRKQPARGTDQWIGQSFTEDGEMFEITGTSQVKGLKVVDYIDEKGEEYYANIEEVKEWLEQPARSVKKRGKGFVNSINIMEPKNKQGTPCLVKTYAILLLIFACILAAGCSQEGLADAGGAADPSGGPDKNEKVIQTVIEKEFSGPDKTYQGLRNAVMDAHDADMSQEEYDAFMKSPVYSDYTGYMKKTYASYFTDNAYDFFITSTPAFRYSVFDGDFNLSPLHIDITQN
jgi:hypothetical protein